MSFIRKLTKDLANFPGTIRQFVISMSHSFHTLRYLHPKIFINITSPCLHKFYSFFKKSSNSRCFYRNIFNSLTSSHIDESFPTHAVLFSHQTNSGDWREWMIVTHLESTLVWKYKKRSFAIFWKTIKIIKKRKYEIAIRSYSSGSLRNGIMAW